MSQFKKFNSLEMRRLLLVFLFAVFLISGVGAQNHNLNTITKAGQTFYIYKVKSGEGLYAVSRQFGVSIDDIKKNNPGVENGLNNGQQLLIPVAEKTAGGVASDQSPVSQSKSFKHTVSRGETLYSVSKMYNTSVEAIIRLNPGLTESISEGQIINIPQTQINKVGSENVNYQYHTILAKETLYGVSRTYSVSPQSIVDANPGLSIETFSTGKTIRIPMSGTGTKSGVTTGTITENKIHKVQKGETLYSIAKEYGVSVSEIEKANSILASQLKRNMEIVIPVNVTVDLYGGSAQEIDADRLLSQTNFSKRADVINIGLLLPFTDKTDNQHLRIQEYYEGLMLAIKKMKASGANVDLFVFDINSKAKLESLLGTMEMESLDLLIGGMTDEQIKIMSDFSTKNKIKYVVPFSSRNNEVLNNGYIFQVNTPHSYLYSKASDVFVKTFKDKNVIIVNVPGKSDKTEFIATLKADLRKTNIEFSELNLNDDFEKSFTAALKDENIIVPTSGDSGSLNKIISVISEAHQERENLVTNLFGYPEWQTFDSHLTELMHNFGTYFYSTFYVDEKDREVTHFLSEFKKWYDRDLLPTHPKYGIFGYDTGLFFINAIYRNGLNFEEKMNHISNSSLQFAFNFERVNNWSGFINTGLFLIHYDRNGVTRKLDKSK